MWKKGKNDLNLQVVYDYIQRFNTLDVGFTRSTSDILSFVNSYNCKKLNEEGSLVPGMCVLW